MDGKRWLEAWRTSLVQVRPASIRQPFTVEGSVDKHVGPRWLRARVSVIAEPAAEFSVSVELPEALAAEMERQGLTEAAVFGILDVLALENPFVPVLGARIRFVGATVDPVDSSKAAFRLAGRDAAIKILGK
jgi:hypothetical protein